MDLVSAINRLVHEDYLDEWGSCISDLDKAHRVDAYKAAEPRWTERMVREGLLMIHPVVAAQLKNQNWLPSDLQRRMIWASVLASIEGENSKERFYLNKARIIKKHGNKWWLDVYQRMRPAYAARMRIKKNQGNTGSAIAMLARHSSVIGQALHEEREAALRMIPKD